MSNRSRPSSVLVLGGTRSGKTRHAETLARSLSPSPVYLATSRAHDDDHARRIGRHRAARGDEWRTIEEERCLSTVELGAAGGEERAVVVVDCVTLWLANLWEDMGHDAERCLAEARAELDRALARRSTWIFVSNELGQGVHAESAAARRFVDLHGLVNQHLAALVERVVLVVAGIPLVLKGNPFS